MQGVPIPAMPLTPRQALTNEYLEKEKQKLAPQPSKTLKSLPASAKRTGTEAKSGKRKFKNIFLQLVHSVYSPINFIFSES